MNRNQDLFLFQHKWENPQFLPQDGSSRSYARVHKGDQTAMFVWYAPTGNTLDYYIKIDDFLKKNGIRTPEIYAADPKQGFAILEDFGNVSMKQAMIDGADKATLYAKACETLKQLRTMTNLPPMMDFRNSNCYIGARRVIDWYLPATSLKANRPDEVTRFFKVWDGIEAQLPPPAQGFIYVDFHAENIHVLKDGTLGFIDFHDPITNSPLYGPLMYDLSNLLFDMRMEVPEDIRKAAMKDLTQEEKNWVFILATMFHCRLLGQCIRWAIVDNKAGYLKYLPRLENYVREALKNPALAPLKHYFDDLGLDFTTSQRLNIDAVKPLIAADAF
jgi:aminoglycoside/choline kinase family phosphotransferase